VHGVVLRPGGGHAAGGEHREVDARELYTLDLMGAALHR
jgi:hypothetical protein